ncbi:MAG: DUF6702 family protein [Bacteroidota bacterium]|nr:DUF6702 family protein [Bacteroidota bacterium]
MRPFSIKVFFSICLFFTLLFFSAFKHPFYLGVADLKYNSTEKSIQGSIKLFTNDFENALKKDTKQTVDLINAKDKALTKKIITDYLTKYFNLKLNGETKSYTVIGFEREQEAVFTYIEFKNCETPKTIEIENSLLYDSFKEQMNIVHFELSGTKKSVKVNNPDKKITFNF